MKKTNCCADLQNAKLQWILLQQQNMAAKGIGLAPQEAVQYYKKLVDRQNAYAAFALGLCYEKGTGVRKNSKQAIGWYQFAEELIIDTRAKYPDTVYRQTEQFIRQALSLPDSVLFDEETDQKRFKIWRALAEDGNNEAKRRVGEFYLRGDGVVQDYEQAVDWLCQAAKAADPKAQATLGRCYESGLGVPKDKKQAFLWFLRAALQEEKSAQLQLSDMYLKGAGVAKSREKAVYWRRRYTENYFRWVENMEK